MKTVLKGDTISKSLRKFLMLLVAASCSLASCVQHPVSLRGTLSGVESDSLLVFVSYMNESKTFRTDTVALVDNSFQLQLPDSSFYIQFAAKPVAPNGAIRMINSRILFFPGDRLVVKGDIENYKVSGSQLYDGLAKYNEINKLEDEVRSLNQAYSKAYREKNEEDKQRIKKEVKAVHQKLQEAKFEVVKSEPNTMVAAYFATQLYGKQGLEAISLLSQEVKEGSMGKLIEKAEKSCKDALLREKAKLDVQSGKPIPDFKLKTIEGKEVTLTSFSGKYLLVDFWGTWCGWCIKGIPDMKKVYKKYRHKIEFLGICCGDTEKKWRDGVAHHQLPWVNVLEGNSSIAARFGVTGFPTKVLVGPDGKLIKVFVGESPELYKYLDQLFSK